MKSEMMYDNLNVISISECPIPDYIMQIYNSGEELWKSYWKESPNDELTRILRQDNTKPNIASIYPNCEKQFRNFQNSNYEITEQLKSFNDFSKNIQNEDMKSSSPLYKAVNFIINNQIEELKTLINDDPNVLTSVLLEIAALKGNSEIFRYLVLNNISVTNTTCNYAIISGNQEIISLLADSGYDFGKALLIAIEYHRNEIADWIISNYKCPLIDPLFCLETLNIQAFCFCIHNKIGNPLIALLDIGLIDLATGAMNDGFTLDTNDFINYIHSDSKEVVEFILQNKSKIFSSWDPKR